MKEGMIPCISLWQPWAGFVALKWKTIETRYHDRFKKLKGQRIAIHGTKKFDKSAFKTPYLPKYFMPIFTNGHKARYARGQIICTATVSAARWAPNIGFDEREEWNKKAMCEVAGKFCLFLEDIKPVVERVPYRGRQGIFYVAEELIKLNAHPPH